MRVQVASREGEKEKHRFGLVEAPGCIVSTWKWPNMGGTYGTYWHSWPEMICLLSGSCCLLLCQDGKKGKWLSLLPSQNFVFHTNLSSWSQYWKILQAHEANTRKYWLVEVIENDCIVTWVRVYNEISPEPSGNPSGSAFGISPGDISLYTPPLVTIQLQCALAS